MPPPRPPADGPPGTEPDPVLAFGVVLDRTSDEIASIYDRLGALAEGLDAEAREHDRDPDWLAGMGRRMALVEILSAVLDARHAIHGGLIGIVRARSQAPDQPGRHV